MKTQKLDLENVKNLFEKFAKNECEGVSPLYFNLSLQVAQDKELIEIASRCRERQPIPNLFFAAVHYLLLKNPEIELAKYYPSIHPESKLDLPFHLFKEFCLKNQDEIISIQKSRIVQTNALNRTAYLMPIISNLFENKQINLIDFGTSAGLNLNLDKYEYHYNDIKKTGKSPVKIKSKIIGSQTPPFKKPMIIHRKIGIDQNPLDLKVEDNALWLKSLIWADRTERFERMEQAIHIACHSDIQLVEGDQPSDLEHIISLQEENIPLVIVHTHVLYQFKYKERKQFRTLIDQIGKQRDLTYLAVEGHSVFSKDYGSKAVLVVLTQYKNGNKSSKLVAETNGHANWIKWKRIHNDIRFVHFMTA